MREELVSGLSHDFGVHPYAKWRGAFWRLLSLVDLGIEPGHGAALEAAEQTLEWVASPRRLAAIHKRRIDGRVRRCASQDGRALQTCLHVGLRGDPRLDVLAESLVDTQWPDGGWNCDARPHVTHSSFNETWGRSSVSPRTARMMPSPAAPSSSFNIESSIPIALESPRTRC